jgi:ADP-ribosylation factor GTPase-activating protein 1
MSMSMSVQDQMAIKSIPGNDKCVDCPAIHPQWASVSYGTLFCLECSGLHRSLGVHISFVRSLTMDGWSEKQLGSMRAGGNAKFVQALRDAGCPADMVELDSPPEQTAKYQKMYENKYACNVMEPYRQRVVALRDGQEPPPIPGYEKPGVGDVRGIEPLVGESEEDYCQRQAMLKEEAKARIAARCGGGGMQGIGSGGYTPPGQGGGGAGLDTKALSDGAEKAAAAARAAAEQANAVLGSMFGKLSTAVKGNDVTSNAATIASSWWGKAAGAVTSLVEEPKEEGMFFPRTNTLIEDKARAKAAEEDRQKAAAAAAAAPAAPAASAQDDWDDWNDSPAKKKSPRAKKKAAPAAGAQDDWDDWDAEGSAKPAAKAAGGAAADDDDGWGDEDAWGDDAPAKKPRSPADRGGGTKSPSALKKSPRARLGSGDSGGASSLAVPGMTKSGSSGSVGSVTKARTASQDADFFGDFGMK